MASKPKSSSRYRALGSTSSPEYLTIRECYPHLVSVVKDSYDTIGDRLFSKGYVSRKTHNFIRMDSKMPTEKARKLLDTTLDRIVYRPNVFNDFIEILEKEGPSTGDLVRELREVYKTKGECLVEPSPDHNAGDSDCDSVDLSSEDSFHSASELDESLPVPQAAPVQKDIATPSNREDKTTDKLSDIVSQKVAGFICPFCKKCTVEQFFSKAGCPKAVSCVTEQQPMFPYLDTKMLRIKDRRELESRLVREMGDMICLFARFRSSMIDSFESQKLEVKRVVDFVLSLGKLASLCPKALSEKDEGHLRESKSILDVFSALLPYTSFFHYRIIETLVSTFGTLQDGEKLKQYVAAFNRFCKRSVFEVPPNVFRCAIEKSEDKVFSIKYITEATPSLGEIVVVHGKIAEVLGVSSWALQLCSIEKGCVCLRFWIPPRVADHVLPVSQSQQAALNDIGVRILDQVEVTEEEQSARPRLSQTSMSSLLHILSPRPSQEAQPPHSLTSSQEEPPPKGKSPPPSSPTQEGGPPIPSSSSQEGNYQQLSLKEICVRDLEQDKQLDDQLRISQGGTQSSVIHSPASQEQQLLPSQVGKNLPPSSCSEEGKPPPPTSPSKEGETPPPLLSSLEGVPPIPSSSSLEENHPPLSLEGQYTQLSLGQQLITACEKGSLSEVISLIERGASVHSTDIMWRITPLIASCEGGHSATAQLLIEKGADLNEQDWRGMTPLIAACEGGHFTTAQLLIEKGADLNKHNWRGMTPLIAACEGGHSATAQLLIDKGADLSSYVGVLKALDVAEWKNIPELVNILEKAIELTHRLMDACKRGSTSEVSVLLKQGASVHRRSDQGMTPLIAACEGGHSATAELLIEKGADLSKQDWREKSPLIAACEGGHSATAQLLIEKEADLNKQDWWGRTPLIAACEGGHSETAQLLMEKGADLNTQDKRKTPLIAACEVGHSETVQLLIEKGADLDKQDNRGRTPLIAACERGHSETAELLIEKGEDLEKQDKSGRTPLIAACEGGHSEMAQSLIEKGADLNKQDWRGMTSLIAACKIGHSETAEMLIEKGADLNKQDESGRTPLTIANISGQAETALLLIKHGAVLSEGNKATAGSEELFSYLPYQRDLSRSRSHTSLAGSGHSGSSHSSVCSFGE